MLPGSGTRPLNSSEKPNATKDAEGQYKEDLVVRSDQHIRALARRITCGEGIEPVCLVGRQQGDSQSPAERFEGTSTSPQPPLHPPSARRF